VWINNSITQLVALLYGFLNRLKYDLKVEY